MFCTAVTNTSAMASANNLAVSTRLVVMIGDGRVVAAVAVVVVVGCGLIIWGCGLELLHPLVVVG